jgi:hypothetical protein
MKIKTRKQIQKALAAVAGVSGIFCGGCVFVATLVLLNFHRHFPQATGEVSFIVTLVPALLFLAGGLGTLLSPRRLFPALLLAGGTYVLVAAFWKDEIHVLEVFAERHFLIHFAPQFALSIVAGTLLVSVEAAGLLLIHFFVGGNA